MILFDDNSHKVPYDKALTMTHEYAHTEETKGGDVEVNAAWYIFTTNWHWREWKQWQGNDWEAWERRVTDHVKLDWLCDSRHNIIEPKQADADFVKWKEDGFDWSTLQDPPRQFSTTLTDDQVEDLLMKEPTGKWLPKRQRVGLTPQQVVEKSQAQAVTPQLIELSE